MRRRTVIHGVALALALTWGMAGSSGAMAAGGGGVRLLDARVDLEDQPSLQRGARLFVNYCLSCHGATFMRYNRMAADIGISEEQLKENLMFASEKVGSQMNVSMSAEDAEAWFGKAPPDLSVIARARGPNWLYTYLMGFYRDDARPTGVNNLVFKDVGMPHALAELQGVQGLRRAAAQESTIKLSGPSSVNQLLELTSKGSMNPAEYRQAARDVTGFLVYIAEPAKLQRYKVGFWVLLFLVVLYLLTRSLYKEYWKDVY